MQTIGKSWEFDIERNGKLIRVGESDFYEYPR